MASVEGTGTLAGNQKQVGSSLGWLRVELVLQTGTNLPKPAVKLEIAPPESGPPPSKDGCKQMAFLVFDFETTGLEPGRHEPIQVAALLFGRDLVEIGAFESLMRPLRPELASPEALAVNGRSLADLAAEPHPGEVLARFVDFARTAGEPVVIVGHNVGFDLEFLRQEEASYGVSLLRRDQAIDTCTLARVHLEARGAIANSKLATVAAHYGIEFQAHEALGDVRATGQILARFMTEAPILVERATDGTLLSGLLADAADAEPGSPFISSLSSHFENKGWLSPKQIAALVRITDRGGAVRAR